MNQQHGHHTPRAPHDQHAGHSPKMFRDRFWLSAAFTIPAVFWSEHIEMLLGYRALWEGRFDRLDSYLKTLKREESQHARKPRRK